MYIELIGIPKSPDPCRGCSVKMETIWLQRPSGDIPWGFRLQGGQEFNQPLSVQRVTPGSVAASTNGLSPGDVILKIGNVNATTISHNEAQEVITGATNILQLTIKKGSVTSAPSSPPVSSNPQYGGSNQNSVGQFSPQYQQQQQSSQPDYRVGGMYQSGDSNVNDSRGYNNAQPYSQNNAYDMRQFEQTPPISGYSTLPARSGGGRQTNDGFRPVPSGQQEQNKYPYSSSTGIQLQSVARNDGNYSQPMSPVQFNRNNEQPQFQRQNSVGQQNRNDTNPGYQPSQIRKPVPFSPGSGYNYSQNGSATLPLQRQTSSGQSTGNKYESTISSPYQPGSFLPRSDDAPPPPPPPTNYQPESYGRPAFDQNTSQSPYQRQTSQSQQNSYGASPYEQRQNNYNAYQSRQNQDMYGAPEPQYQRQGSRGYQYDSPQQSQQQSYQRQPSNQTHYDGSQPQYQSNQQSQYGGQFSPPQQGYTRQTSREQAQPQYGGQHPPMNRQHSREQHIQPPMHSHPVSPPGNTINSFEDILSPFENFQNSNYCDKLFARSPENRGDMDSGVSMSSDTPRSNQSSTYSPPQPYSTGYNDHGDGPHTQNLLRPAPQAPPPPPVTPPPPPPPPPPSDWTGSQKKKVPLEGPRDIGGQENMPDKVLNTMLKNAGTQKPFAYVPSGADLKEFKERARQRRQPRSVMPRGYSGPEVDEQQPVKSKTAPGGVPNPDTGMYRHAQYNSPLRMYSADNAKEAFNIQSGGNVDVSGLNNSTPERRPSDIKESEVYKMCLAADAQGKHSDVVSDNDADVSHDQSSVSRDRSSVSHDRESESRDSQERVFSPQGSRAQGLSFRVLQWLTDTADDDEDEFQESKTPRKPRDPLLRHNSVDDEMRFSGFHTKADIPSKAFQRLTKMAGSDNSTNVTPKHEQNNKHDKDDDDDGTVGNYDEASIRYRGDYIPSPSFRLLQTLAKNDEARKKSGSPAYLLTGTDSSDDGLPDRLNEEDMIDKRYRGGNVPSKSFKTLKLSRDDDNKPGSDTESGGSKIKVINRSKSPQVPPKPDRAVAQEAPSTDF